VTRLDLLLRCCGGAVATTGGLVAAVVEVLLTPLYWSGHAVPVAPALALLTGPVLAFYGHRVTSHWLGAVSPGVVWLAVVIAAATRSTNGYVLLPGTAMGIATLFCGMAGAMVGAAASVRRTQGHPGGAFQ
jgi:hypothetical protein